MECGQCPRRKLLRQREQVRAPSPALRLYPLLGLWPNPRGSALLSTCAIGSFAGVRLRYQLPVRSGCLVCQLLAHQGRRPGTLRDASHIAHVDDL